MTDPVLRDLSSLSNPHEARVTNLDWNVTVDFDESCLVGEATYLFERVDPSAQSLCLDTAALVIHSVTDQDNNVLDYKHHTVEKKHLGQKLAIAISENVTSVTIRYQTTLESSAAQWLPPAQTAGKKHPYLFTQCQAIHARSLVPCQDMPGVKMTYSATVTVPSWAVCVMSALVKKEGETSNGQKIYHWEQPVPISSYLLAMAVGDLQKKDISDRCAIWSEPALVEGAAYEFAQTELFLQTAEALAGTPYAWGRYDLLCLPPSFPYGGMENPCLTFVTPTLLAGDRSLADVVAHEIAHSWTGNLVTNATWDHFWLNEGWTTWFQRKIMARIHKNDKFLDFDALGGYKALGDTVKQMPEEFTKLVLPIGDKDPDDAYSRVAYEKGFNLLMALERRVGKEAFEKFFQAYVSKYAYKILTSDDFRNFFMKHFEGKEAVKDIDWETWFHSPGMPPEEPNFDRSLAEASEHLAECWVAVDRQGRMLPTQDIKAWSTDQLTCFLDALQSMTEDQPLQLSTLKAMDKAYSFAESKNAEILFLYCQLEIAAEDESILFVVLHFITSQGRMKFVRPLYRALFNSKFGRDVAIEWFLQHKDCYHPICAKMVASDLQACKRKNGSFERKLAWTLGVAAVAAAIGFVFMRRRR